MQRLVVRTGVFASGSFLAWDVGRRDWSERHTWTTAFQQYILYYVLGFVGRWRLHRLLKDAEDGELVQRSLLADLLKRHNTTQYGKDCRLVGISTFEEFRRIHRITHHDDYIEYISRVRKGEEGVMAPGIPKLLAMTSGTSGSPKLVPHVSDVSNNFFMRGVCVAFAVLHGKFPNTVDNLQRSLKLVFKSSFQEMDNGMRIGSNSSSPDNKGFDSLLCAYASPKAAYQLQQEPDALYAHALFALKERNLGIIEANFAPVVCLLLDTIRQHRRSLVQDLRNGHIWDRKIPERAPPAEIRDAIDAALGGPDPKRALEVDKLLKSGASLGDLWPQLGVVMTTDSGSFETAAARMREMLGSNIQVYSPFYAATEGLLGVNIFPDRPFGMSSYLLDPGSMVFELLPVEWRESSSPPNDAPIFPWEADIGQAYEVIVTTRGGLCRYRLGDIVRVLAKCGQMPIVAVEERASHFLPSLHGERVAEVVFHKALARAKLASRIRGACVVDAPGKLCGGRFHVFVEQDAVAIDLTEDSALLDSALCAEHAVYASFRHKGAVQQLQLHTVAPGTFTELRPTLAKRSSSDMPPVSGGQVKVPTVLRDSLADRLLQAETR